MHLDFGIIAIVAAVPVEGLSIHGAADRDRRAGRPVLRHLARAGAAVADQVAGEHPQRATST